MTLNERSSLFSYSRRGLRGWRESLRGSEVKGEERMNERRGGRGGEEEAKKRSPREGTYHEMVPKQRSVEASKLGGIRS